VTKIHHLDRFGNQFLSAALRAQRVAIELAQLQARIVETEVEFAEALQDLQRIGERAGRMLPPIVAKMLEADPGPPTAA
jgi:hypothetical protein